MKLAICLWLLVFSVTTFANWTKAVVDSGPYKPVSLIFGKGRNDDTVRLYWTSDDSLLREATYRNYSWQKGIVGKAGSNLVISPAHNDGINRIYTTKADTLYEYTWANGGWLKESYLLPDSASPVFASPLRNDDTIRMYLVPHQYQIFYLYELTYRYGVWEIIKTDSFPEPMGGDFAAVDGRNDDTLRLYTQWAGVSFSEITYSSGQWHEEILNFSGNPEMYSTSLVIGNDRNDGINRVCIGAVNYMISCYDAVIYEISYSLSGWSITGCPYNWWVDEGGGWRPEPSPLLIGLVRKNTVGLYAYIYGNGMDTTGLFEFTYHSTGWKREMVDKGAVACLTAGQGRNDDTSRLYGIQNSTIIEFSRSTEVINETDIPRPIIPILQITPNPFSTRTEISYQIAATDQASICIYDAAGRLIKKFPKTQSPESKVYWFGEDEAGASVPTGIYFCQLRTGSKTVTKKITLLK